MSKTTNTCVRLGLVLAAAFVIAGCKVREAAPPTLTGPSELGLSLTLTALPDTITQDGASQSQIVVFARDANSNPVANVPVRMEIVFAGQLFDFGRLSARNVVTGADGRAFVVYTAPPRPAESVDLFTIVSIWATPTGSNFANALRRELDIRLVPPGQILPQNEPPIADFTFSPQTPLEAQQVVFDASPSRDPDGQLVSYTWNFGDQTTGSGSRVTHTYSTGGTYSVTLTVIDARNAADSETKSITVTTSSSPTAGFTISPTSPNTGESVTFNAAGSQAAAGRRLVKYEWTLGDGEKAEGVLVSHEYDEPGSYTVTLTVTDDLGRTATVSQSVGVSALAPPTASFVFSPLTPGVGQTVRFDGTASRAPGNRTIVSWDWNLGNGQFPSGQVVSTSYSAIGTYTAQLTVTDSLGRTASFSQSVSVVALSTPTASFVFSPQSPLVGQTVNFDARGSSASPGSGRTIVHYEWNFGDGDTDATTGPIVGHAYGAANTYNVQLKVTDSAGQFATTSRTVTVTQSPTQNPTANFNFSPSTPSAGTFVNFDASPSSAQGGQFIRGYEWNFGDTTFVYTCPGPDDPTTQCGPLPSATVRHRYSQAGTWNVTLTVIDSLGRRSASTVRPVGVTAPVP